MIRQKCYHTFSAFKCMVLLIGAGQTILPTNFCSHRLLFSVFKISFL